MEKLDYKKYCHQMITLLEEIYDGLEDAKKSRKLSLFEASIAQSIIKTLSSPPKID